MSIRTEIRAFLKATGMPQSRFGRLALNDPAFVRRLGFHEPRAETIAKVRTFMAEYAPERVA